MPVILTAPVSGHLLVAHLAAYGLGLTLDHAGEEAWVGHDQQSLSFEPQVHTTASHERVGDVVRLAAAELEPIIEADLEPGKAKNARRSVIWARASFNNDKTLAASALASRQLLLDGAAGAASGISSSLASGLGAPLAWGTEDMKPSRGATWLDGVIGNNTSDLVRGVVRGYRPCAATAVAVWSDPPEQPETDKTNWAPAGTQLGATSQWLATLGLGLLPVGHRQLASSRTPACWLDGRRPRGVVLPVLALPASIPRLRALLALSDLPRVVEHCEESGPAGRLRALRCTDVVEFDRVESASGGGSVAFRFARGRVRQL